jgi:hypothetical protein
VARRRRGEVVAKLLRFSALPLPPFFAFLDRISPWILRSR